MTPAVKRMIKEMVVGRLKKRKERDVDEEICYTNIIPRGIDFNK